MILGVVLLYVGAVLAVNGLWLIGTALSASRAAKTAAANPATAEGNPGTYGGGRSPAEVRAEAAAGEELAGERVITEPRGGLATPLFIHNREIAILNIFTGFIGIVIAAVLLAQGNAASSLADIRSAGFILLFAFTYLWVAYNQYANAGGRALGWYSLFVAITAIPAGIYTLQAAAGNTAFIWLGANWFAWALLWLMFWGLLALELPIALITGVVALIEGIGTSWALAIAILEGKLSFLFAGAAQAEGGRAGGARPPEAARGHRRGRRDRRGSALWHRAGHPAAIGGLSGGDLPGERRRHIDPGRAGRGAGRLAAGR
jgi:putative amide transporter protein